MPRRQSSVRARQCRSVPVRVSVPTRTRAALKVYIIRAFGIPCRTSMGAEHPMPEPNTQHPTPNTEHPTPNTPTPLIRLAAAFPDLPVYAKCEFLAPSGCFKIRGALHLLRHLRSKGEVPSLVVPSMGNTALGA